MKPAYKRMEYPPRLVVMLALLKYMTPEQKDAMKRDLAKLKHITDKVFVDRFKKHMDLELLVKAPMVPQDAMVYNYLVYEFNGKFIKTKLLAQYEKEVMKDQLKAMEELKQSEGWTF